MSSSERPTKLYMMLRKQEAALSADIGSKPELTDETFTEIRKFVLKKSIQMSHSKVKERCHAFRLLSQGEQKEIIDYLEKDGLIEVSCFGGNRGCSYRLTKKGVTIEEEETK